MKAKSFCISLIWPIDCCVCDSLSLTKAEVHLGQSGLVNSTGIIALANWKLFNVYTGNFFPC